MKQIYTILFLFVFVGAWGQAGRLHRLNPVDTNVVSTRSYADTYDNTITELPTTKQLAIDSLGRFQSFDSKAAIIASAPPIGIRVLDRATGAQYTVDDAPLSSISDSLLGIDLGGGKYLNIRLGEGSSLDLNWFGVDLTDSITSYTAIQGSLTYLNELGGGKLLIPKGFLYGIKPTNVNSGFIIDGYRGITIQGQGKDSTIIFTRGISAKGVSDLIIKDIAIVRYDTADNFANLLNLQSTDSANPTKDVVIDNVRFEYQPIQPSGNTPQAIFLYNAKNVLVQNSEFVHCQIKGGGANAPIFDNVDFINNDFEDHTNLCISIVNSGGDPDGVGIMSIKNVDIIGNRIKNPRGTGVFFIGADGESSAAADTIINLTVKDNYVYGDDWSYITSSWGEYPSTNSNSLLNLYLGRYADNIIVENNFSAPEVRDTNAMNRTEGISIVCKDVPNAFIGKIRVHKNTIKKIDQRPIVIDARHVRELEVTENTIDSTRFSVFTLDSVQYFNYSRNNHFGWDATYIEVDSRVDIMVISENTYHGERIAGEADIEISLSDSAYVRAFVYNNHHDSLEDRSLDFYKTDTSQAAYWFDIHNPFDYSRLGTKGNILNPDSTGTNVFITPTFKPDTDKIHRSQGKTAFDYDAEFDANLIADGNFKNRDIGLIVQQDMLIHRTFASRLNNGFYQVIELGDVSSAGTWRVGVDVTFSIVGNNSSEGTAIYKAFLQASGTNAAIDGDNENYVYFSDRTSGVYDYIGKIGDLELSGNDLIFKVYMIDGRSNSNFSVDVKVYNNSRDGSSLNDIINPDLTSTVVAHALTASDESLSSLPASQVTSYGDSSTVQLEITGLDSRVTTLESNINSITATNVSSTGDSSNVQLEINGFDSRLDTIETNIKYKGFTVISTDPSSTLNPRPNEVYYFDTTTAGWTQEFNVTNLQTGDSFRCYFLGVDINTLTIDATTGGFIRPNSNGDTAADATEDITTLGFIEIVWNGTDFVIFE